MKAFTVRVSLRSSRGTERGGASTAGVKENSGEKFQGSLNVQGMESKGGLEFRLCSYLAEGLGASLSFPA